MKMRTAGKRILSLLTSLLIAVSVIPFSLPVSASSADRQSAMIHFFQNQGAEGIKDNMTAEEVRMFGVFLSNFYTPFKTNLTDIPSFQELVRDACAFLMGYNDYLSMTAENKQIVDLFTDKMAASVLDVINGEDYALYISSQGASVIAESGTRAYLDAWLDRTEAVNMCTRDGKVFFSAGGNNKASRYCDFAACVTLLVNGSDAVSSYLQNENETAKAEGYLESTLYVSPFGDIINRDGVVLIPACINPYTFSADGDVLPINNSFVMGSLMSKGFRTSVRNDNDVRSVMDIQAIDTKSPLLVAGIYTAPPLDEETDFFGSFVSGSGALNGNADNARAALNKYADGVEKFINNEIDGEFSIAAFFDENSVRDAADNKSVGWLKSLLGIKPYAGVSRMTQPLVVRSADIDDVMQELYTIPDAKNGYGGYNFDGAVKAYIFKSPEDTRETIASQLVTSSAFGKTDMFGIGTSGNGAAVYCNNVTANAGKLLTGAETLLYYICASELNSMGSAEAANLEALYYGDSYAYNKLIAAPVVRLFQYHYVKAASSIGAALTAQATQEDGSSLLVANKFNFWAEIFLAYMYRGCNGDLPPVNIDGLDAAMKSLLGTAVLDPDELAAENQKLANKMLKTSLELVSDSRNEIKGSLVVDFINSTILKYHRQMLGLNSTDIGSVDNSGKMFTGFSSPVTVPGLAELPVTSALLDRYHIIYVGALITAIAAGIIFVIVHMRSVQQILASIVLLAFCLLLPQTFLDSVTSLTNTVTNGAFSDRFNYWAIIQHQQALQEISIVGSTGSSNAEVLAGALIDARSYYDRVNGVQLRWMAAKKAQSFTDIADIKVADSTIPGYFTYMWLFSGYAKQESYSSDAMAAYVYRTYTSIAESASANYEATKSLSGTVGDLSSSAVDPELGVNVFAGVPVSPIYKSRPNYGTRADNLFYRSVALSDNTVTAAIKNTEADLSGRAGLSIDGVDSNARMSAYLLYCESPFYYFYNAIKASMAPSGDEGEFLRNFLSDEMYKSAADNQTKGALIDFLDFEGLCSNVIPYMQAANNYVIAWTDKYGTDVNTYEPGGEVKSRVLNKVWNMYCPWADSLTEMGMESVSAFGKSYLIQNAFNPADYREFRPMVFSEAQRIEDGVTENAMTDVERKLLRVQAAAYKDLRYLANYAQFDDETLITAAAMAATFSFNKEFSETSLTGTGITLYPQGFELKNFGFDAFLRLILLNSTGISVMSAADIYEVVIDEEGMFVGLLLLLIDWLNIYIVPACMCLFLVIAFVLGVLFTSVMIMQPPEGVIKLTFSTVILPALLYMAATLGYAAGLSLLMGEGLTAYVGSKSAAFVTNSPGITLMFMLILAVALIVCYLKILYRLCISTASYAKRFRLAAVSAGGMLMDALSRGFTGIRTRAGMRRAARTAREETNGNADTLGDGNVTDTANGESTEDEPAESDDAYSASENSFESGTTTESASSHRRNQQLAEAMNILAAAPADTESAARNTQGENGVQSGTVQNNGTAEQSNTESARNTVDEQVSTETGTTDSGIEIESAEDSGNNNDGIHWDNTAEGGSADSGELTEVLERTDELLAGEYQISMALENATNGIRERQEQTNDDLTFTAEYLSRGQEAVTEHISDMAEYSEFSSDIIYEEQQRLYNAVTDNSGGNAAVRMHRAKPASAADSAVRDTPYISGDGSSTGGD